jgi:hypothetical protein
MQDEPEMCIGFSHKMSLKGGIEMLEIDPRKGADALRAGRLRCVFLRIPSLFVRRNARLQSSKLA